MPLTKNTISNLALPVEKALENRRLGEALKALEAMARASSTRFETLERISALADNYAMLSRYLIDGHPDPERGTIAADIAAEAAALKSGIERSELCESGEPSLYFSTMRFEATRESDTIPVLLDSYLDALQAGAPQTETEAMATRLFNRIWVTYPLSRTDADALHQVLASGLKAVPDHARVLLTGALLLGGLQYFDTRRAILLADIYRINHDAPAGMVALTALVMMLAAVPRYALGARKLHLALASLADCPTLASDAATVFMQLIRSRDTERVTRKITDEIMPDIMRMAENSKDFTGKDAASIIDEDGDLNPEWEERFEQSGLSERLRELGELQGEGADTTMASMGNLKDFPFFNEPANWFLPFYPEHSIAAGAGVKGFTNAIADNPQMCSGDKYSLLLFYGRFASQLPDGLTRHLDSMDRHIKEEMASELLDEKQRLTDSVNSFVRDVYRFFKLFRRKNEFRDPFVRPVNPVDVPILDSTVATDADAMALAAEFYFRRGHYGESLDLFNRLEDLTPASSELYQKKGYALEMTGQTDEALKAYDTADLIDSDSVWTLRRVASLLRSTGRPQESLAYYDRIRALRHDKFADIAGRASALESLSRYSEALTLYYQADYMRPDRADVVRALARCQLVTGEYQKSLASCLRLAKLPGIVITAHDHICRGHAALALADYHAAVDAYAAAIASLQFDHDKFMDAITADAPMLKRLGADPLTTAIVTEAAADRAGSLGAPIR